MSEPKPKDSSGSGGNIVKYSLALGAIVVIGIGLLLFFSKKETQNKKPPLPKDKDPTPRASVEQKPEPQEQDLKTPHSSQNTERSIEFPNSKIESPDSKAHKGSFGDYMMTKPPRRGAEEKKMSYNRASTLQKFDEDDYAEDPGIALRTEENEANERLTRSEMRGATMRFSQKPFNEEFKPHNDPEYSNKHPIFYEQCVRRAGLLSNATYEVALNLNKEDYEGHVKITFELKQVTESLYLDAHGKNRDNVREKMCLIVSTVRRVFVNSVELDPIKVFSTHAIELPESDLLNLTNVVEIYFKNQYSKEGDGLQRYTDSHQLEYIWSKNGPVFAHRMFPCFDQPNIKAIIKLLVFVPQPYIVTSNEDVASVYTASTKTYKKYGFLEDFNTPRKIWGFKETPPIPLHYFKLFAGHFDEIQCSSQHKEFKMSILCRKGLKSSLKESAEQLFEIIGECLKHFEDHFGCSFPFSKYDMVVLPDNLSDFGLNSVISAISEQHFTFSEHVSDSQKFTLVLETVCDLVYTWFGVLTALNWWDDRWFPKSFSTFVVHDALDTLSALKEKYPDSWVHFFFEKEKVYVQDQLPTSNPIVSKNAKETSHIEAEIDDLANIKGAACIKQLAHAVGLNKFWGAVKIYFAKYAWKNASFDEFLHEVVIQAKEKQIKGDLDKWKKDWLLTAGYNILNVDWEVTADGKLESITIRQEACGEDFPFTRSHKVQIGLFDSEGSFESIEVRIADHTTKISNLPAKTPIAILLNYNDIGYVKMKLDEKSLAGFGPLFNKIDNNITRALIWNAQIDMVHDKNVSCIAVIELLTKSIEKERNPVILRNLLSSADYLVSNYLSLALKSKKSSELFQKLQQIVKLESWELNAKEIDIYLERFTSFAREKEDIQILLQWFKNETTEMGVRPPRPSEQWQILSKAFSANLLTYEKLQERINLIHDDPDTVQAHKQAFEVLKHLSSKEKREELWEKILTSPDSFTLTEWEYIFQGFNNEFFPEHYEPFVAPFFHSVVKVYAKTNWSYFKRFYKYLFPRYIEDFLPLIEKIEQVLGVLVKNEVVQEGFENLAKLLMDSVEETRKRRSCFFVNNSQQENLKGSFFEFLSPQLKPAQRDTASSKEIEISREIEENKRATQIVIDNLESIVKTEESTTEAYEVEENEEEEEKTVISRSWKKHDTMKFQISSSLFKDWTKNDAEKYSKMFKTDSKRFSLLEKQFASNQSTYSAILDLMVDKKYYYYIRLVQIFLHLQADSQRYPYVAFNDIFTALKQAKIFNRTLALSDPEKMIAMQLKESPRNVGTGIKETNLLRFEFIELVLRMGVKKYPAESERVANLEKFLEKDIFANFKSADYDYEGYRYEKVHNTMISDLLQHWIEQIKRKFDEIKQINTDVVTLKSVTNYLKGIKVQLIDADIIKCFALSKMLIVDELSENVSNSYTVLCFPEFLEFLIRIAEALDETPDHNLSDKVQRIFPKLL